MNYIECPENYQRRKGYSEKAIFIAGGITSCRPWQKDLIRMLMNEDLVILNPKRKNFDVSKKDINKEQIEWEFAHLNLADAVSFWFPSETICPITLYELGKISMARKVLFVGVHPDYSRREDVEIQTRLIRPEVRIAYSIEELAQQIKSWSGEK